MKIQKATIYILDFDDFGKEEVKRYLDHSLENAGMIMHLTDLEEKDVDNWTDDHALNNIDADYETIYEEL